VGSIGATTHQRFGVEVVGIRPTGTADPVVLDVLRPALVRPGTATAAGGALATAERVVVVLSAPTWSLSMVRPNGNTSYCGTTLVVPGGELRDGCI
jgi:hypothetical protein